MLVAMIADKGRITYLHGTITSCKDLASNSGSKYTQRSSQHNREEWLTLKAVAYSTRSETFFVCFIWVESNVECQASALLPSHCSKRPMVSSFVCSVYNELSPLSTTSCLPLFSIIFYSVPLGNKMYLSLRIAHWESIETWTKVYNKHNFLTQCATNYIQLFICDNNSGAF